jgi:hypothetical protein
VQPDSAERYVPPRRPRDAPYEPPEEPGRIGRGILRFGAALITVAAGIIVAVYANRQTGEPWTSWRDTLRTEGLVILVMSGTWLVLGAVLHTPMAIRRGARVRAGWLVFAGLLAHLAAIGLLAVPLSDFAPAWLPGIARDNPGDLYGTFLACVLIGPSLLAAVGGLFFKPDPPRRPVLRDSRPEDARPSTDSLFTVAGLVVLVGWVPGWLMMFAILAQVADQYDLPLIPAGGMPTLAVGVGLAVPSIVIAVLQRLCWPGLLDQVTRRLLILGAPAVLLAAALVAQLAHALNGGIVLFTAIFVLPPAYLRTVRTLHRRLTSANG